MRYRPIRIGFLIREGSIEDLVKASGLNTVLWGGIYNPIIPVNSTDSASAERLIDLFHVDVLHAVIETPEIKSLIEKHPFLRDSSHFCESLYYEDWQTKKKVLGFLDSRDIVNYFWEDDLRHRQKNFKSNFVLVKWQESDPLANLLAIQFGHFPKPSVVDFKFDYEDIFKKGLRTKQINIGMGEPVKFVPLINYSQLEATAAELSVYAGGVRFNGNGLYVGDSNKFADLINFWNLRASGIHLAFLANDAKDRTLKIAQAQMSNLGKLPSRNPNREDWLTLYHAFDDKDALAEVVKLFAVQRQVSTNHVSETSWNGYNVQPGTACFDGEQSIADVDKPFDRYAVTIRLPKKNFLTSTQEDVGSQYLAISIDAYSEFGYSGYTLKPPFIKELEEFYAREIGFDPWAIRIEKEGLAYLTHAYSHSITLYPILYQTLIEKIFEIKGIKAQTSQPGLLTNKLLEKIDGIHGGTFLKIKGVRKLLQETKPTDWVTRSHATQIIFENDFLKYEKLVIEKRDKPKLTNDQVFDFLLKKDFFRGGLELQCEDCKLSNWLSLKQLDDRWDCEFCGKENKTNTQLKNRGDWKFRKSGLFGKDNNQEGAIPVILTLGTIQQILGNRELIYSTALKLDGLDVDCETDFSILQYRHHRSDEIELAIGECKSAGGVITEEDCQKMKSAYDKITSDKKITCFITFAKTADSFSDTEIECFKKLTDAGVPIILLTNKELEPCHPYWEDEDVPNKHAVSFSDMSRNSIARYYKQTI